MEWVAISFSSGSSWPRDQIWVSCTGRWILYHWATWEAPLLVLVMGNWDWSMDEVTWSESCSAVSNSLRPHGLYNPWNSPGQNTGVGSLFLLQGICPTQVSCIAGRLFTSWATREAWSMIILFYFILFYFIYLAALCGLQDLSSPTFAHSNESTKS